MMTVPNYRKIYVPDDEHLNRVQDNIAPIFTALARDELLNRIPITALIGTGDTIIKHQLTRTPIGYLIISKDANADVWTISLARGEIVLKASAAVTVTMFLF